MSRQRLRNLVEQAGLEITNEESSFPRNEELADILIGPVRSVIGTAEHLIVVPHGPLHNLAFSALRPQPDRSDRAFLTELHRLSYLPAASFVELCLAMERPAFSIGAALVVGDPKGDLPESRREAIDVAQVLGVDPVLGPDARRSVLLTAPLGLGTIHVSCHGFFEAKSPIRSGLDFADGSLTAHDLSKTNIRAGRLVLSACLTGKASVIPGDELLGLTRACFEAGVPTVVTALTEVWEDSSRAFFGVFYRQLAAGRSTLDAFSDAIAAVRAARAFSHPVHWAPYVLNGDWR
jgi:CHAT domain-containing protein